MWEVILIFSFIGCTAWVILEGVLGAAATAAGDALRDAEYRRVRARADEYAEQGMDRGEAGVRALDERYSMTAPVRKIYDRMIAEGMDWKTAKVFAQYEYNCEVAEKAKAKMAKRRRK